MPVAAQEPRGSGEITTTRINGMKKSPTYANIDKIKNYKTLLERDDATTPSTEDSVDPHEPLVPLVASASQSNLPGVIQRRNSKTSSRKSVTEPPSRNNSHTGESARLSHEIRILNRSRDPTDGISIVTNPQRASVVNGDLIVEDPSLSDEMRRVRDSVMAQREDRKKRKEALEDERVIVGQRVMEGHANYVMAYDMLTGIRVAVSRCAQVPHQLTDADFTATKKLAFDLNGSEITPSSKYDFKFKDYAPEVFRDLRRLFKLDAADYLISLTAKYILSEQGSPGKSGSFFYYSRDFRFIIKTIHHSEHKKLRLILKDYYNHVKNNPDTLVSQFYGLHRLKMPWGKTSGVHKVHFLVMNNIFPPLLKMHKQFDLKGSTFGRVTDVAKALAQGKTNIVMKDLNWLDDGEKLLLGPTKRKKFLDQLRKDTRLLERLKIMDYSLLVGVHKIEEAPDGPVADEPLVRLSEDQSRSNSNVIEIRKLTMEDVLALEEEGGIVATNEADEYEPYVYYIGIIDCLTHYSWVKRVETVWRSIGHKRETISAIPPVDYGERFLAFITDGVSGATM